MIYGEYLSSHAIDFMIGSHSVPGSITTHRYRRILEKNNFKEIIVWGNGDYYREMEGIFRGSHVRYHIDEGGEGDSAMETATEAPEMLEHVSGPLPLFICDPRKQEIKARIRREFPQFSGTIFV